MDLLSNLIIDARLLGHDAVDGAYWSLVVEIKFYVLVFVSRAAFADRFWIALIGIASLSALVLHIDPRFAIEAMLAPYWPFFLFGIAGWFLIFGDQRRTAVVLMFASALLYLVAYDQNHAPTTSPLWIDTFIIVTAACMLLALRFYPTVQVPLLAPLGRVSYSLYLLHQYVGVSMIGALTAKGVSTGLAILITVATMIGLSAASFRYIEVPAGKFVMMFYAALVRQLKDGMIARRSLTVPVPSAIER